MGLNTPLGRLGHLPPLCPRMGHQSLLVIPSLHCPQDFNLQGGRFISKLSTHGGPRLLTSLSAIGGPLDPKHGLLVFLCRPPGDQTMSFAHALPLSYVPNLVLFVFIFYFKAEFQ